MKSKLLVSLTSLLLIGSLVACNGPKKESETPTSDPAQSETVPTSETEPTSEEEPTSETEPGSEEEGLNWSAEDKALFAQYIYGVNLPHPGIDMMVEYDDDEEALVLNSINADADADLIDAYLDALEADNWVTDYYNGVYYADLEVETAAGARFVELQFAVVDEDYYITEEEGYLMMYAYDPYYYEWPTELVELVVEYFGSTATVPAFEADYYSVSTSRVTTSGYMSLYCYTDATNAEETYAAALAAANYTVSDELSVAGYYEALSENEDLLIEFVYDEDYKDLDIYINYYEPALTEWPTEDVAEFVEALVPGSTTVVPALNDDSIVAFEVYGLDSLYYFFMGCVMISAIGPASLLDTYEAILADANWTEVADGFLAPAEDILLDVSYDEDYGSLDIMIFAYVPPVLEWPTDDAADIVEALVPGSTTVIPALDGGDDYDVYADADDALLYGFGEIDVYGEATLFDEYVEILEDANWTVNDDGDFISPAEDILIDLYYRPSYGCLEISIYAYTAPTAEWPAETIASYLGDDVTDVLPEFTGDNNGFKVEEDTYYNVTFVSVALDDADAADEALEDYAEILLNANYTLVDEDLGMFMSANDQIIVMIYTYGASLTIEFARNPFMDAVEEFPLDALNNFLGTYELGFNLTAALPDEAEYGYIITTGVAGGYHYFDITVYGDQTEAMDEILAPILLNAGYVYDEGGYYYNEEYHEIDIVYNYSNNTTSITFWE